MDSRIIKTAVITLELNEEEAKWLRDLVQNPLLYPPEKEPEKDKEFRQTLWEALEIW